MPTFAPTTYGQNLKDESLGGHAPEHSLWRHFGGVIAVPYVVWIRGGVANTSPGGSASTGMQEPGHAEVVDSGSGENGYAYFVGGRSYTVTSTEQTILETAGYTVT
jgi:hypothetical protein